ncbi:MAG: hypothetical protein EOO44_01085 [Flavobacterium sp.]|nr:MAG: hypothetical protein EOO44_01085 [Flavobacterium sp.]
MIKTVNKTQAIIAELEADNKVNYLDQQKHIQAISDMNDDMASVRRDFHVKDRNSQTSAVHVILTS